VQYQTGYPFSIITNAPYPTGDYNGDGVNNDRPNLPTFGLTLPDTSQQAYMTGLFKATDFPRPDVLGNMPRNGYRAQRYTTTDISLFKNFAITGTQGTKIQVRAEAFNVFNSVNLNRPQNNLASATFGRSTQSFPGREIQLALKLIF
jgi:hypothetical protein